MLDYLSVNKLKKYMKRRIRLTEGDLRRIVKNSVRRALNEGTTDKDVINAIDEAFSNNDWETMTSALYNYFSSDDLEGFARFLCDEGYTSMPSIYDEDDEEYDDD